jgi:hypothetical protein
MKYPFSFRRWTELDFKSIVKQSAWNSWQIGCPGFQTACNCCTSRCAARSRGQVAGLLPLLNLSSILKLRTARGMTDKQNQILGGRCF